MKLKKPWQIIYNIIVLSAVFITSCFHENPMLSNAELFRQKKLKASELVAENPAAAVRLLDSVVARITVAELDDSLLTDYLVLKSDALFKLVARDSVYATVGAFINDLPKGSHDRVKIHFCNWLADNLNNDGKNWLATKYLDEALALLETNPDNLEKAKTLNLQGVVLGFFGNFKEAHAKLLESAEILEELKDTNSVGPHYINLANNYLALKEYEHALEYYRKAVAITYLSGDSLNYIRAMGNIGVIYLTLNSDSAEYYFNKKLNFMPLKEWSEEALSTWFNLGNLYLDQGKYAQALTNYNRVLRICEKYGIGQGIYRAKTGIGKVHKAMNEYDVALSFFREASTEAEKAGEIPLKMEIDENIKLLYVSTGKYKDAYLAQTEIQKTSDSILSMQKQIAVHDLEMLYNASKSERRNTALKSSLIIMENKMKANTNLLIFVLISAVILGILLYFIYSLYKQRDSAYNALFEKYRRDFESKDLTQVILVKEPENQVENISPENRIYQKLVEYFEKEKPYLHSNLRLESVARNLNLSKGQISRAIHICTGLHFNSFLNKFRVQETLWLLTQPDFRSYKIEAIARYAGFGSRTAFYEAFTQVTGTKPSDHRSDEI